MCNYFPIIGRLSVSVKISLVTANSDKPHPDVLAIKRDSRSLRTTSKIF
jgi:hypothetical protein